MSNSFNPPPFRTQAPPSSTSTCASGSCHSNGSGFSGNISVTGLPTEIMPNMTYTISVTVANTDGNASIAGFQLIAIDDSEASVGTMMNPSTGSAIEVVGGRTFFEHRGTQNFNASNQANWSVQWTAPATISGSDVQIWAVGNIANGNGGSSGDDIVFDMQSFNFAGTEPISSMISASTNVSCNGGNDGSATVQAAGGSPPYSYNWSNNAGTTAMVNNLSAGVYTVTVSDAMMNTSTAAVTITEPTDLTLAITSLLNIDCNTAAGNVSVEADGGTPGYTYAWSNGTMSNVNNNLAVGDYTVTATDINDCTETLTATISDLSDDPIANAGPTQIIDCANLQVVLDGSGSSTGNNFTYLWEAASGGNIVSGETTLFPTVDAAGIYILNVTNTSNDCRSQTQVEVTANFDEPTAIITPPELLDCDGSGTLDASDSFSNGGVSFSWTTNDGVIISGANTATPVISSEGTYTVTVIDNASFCEAMASVSVQIADAPLAVVASPDELSCFNTQIVLDGTGSSSGTNISYLWTTMDGNILADATTLNPTVDQAGSYVLTVTDDDTDCSSSTEVIVTSNTTTPIANGGPDVALLCNTSFVELQAEEDMSGQDVSYFWATDDGNILAGANTLTPSVDMVGTYEFIVTNNNSGCSSSDIVMVIDDTTPPLADAGPDQILGCNGTSLTLDGSNSDSGDGIIYSWTTIDGNIVSGEDTATPIVDAGGTYSLAIFNNNNGCSAQDEVIVTFSAGFDANIANQENVSCFGLSDGTATISTMDGTAPFTYDWSSGGDMATEDNLAAGTYTVTITDDTGCMNELDIEITEPDTLIVNASATDETVAGADDGRLMVLANGGTMPYAILWSSGDTTAFVTDVEPGTYMVTVTDDNGCQGIETVTVNAADCSIALVSTEQDDVSCNGGFDGEATVFVNGGTTPYTYLWSSGGTEMTETGLEAGTHSVTVTDDADCSLEVEVIINEPDVLAVMLENSTDVTCNGGLDGAASVLATGGTMPYQYRWLSTGDEDNMEDDLSAGTHTVSVMDANGCDTTIDVIITEPDAITTDIILTHETEAGANDGMATINISGGTAPYDGATDGQIVLDNLAPDDYTVTITDANNCEILVNFTINSFSCGNINSTVTTTDASCPDVADGSATIEVSDGTEPYTYLWSSGGTAATENDLLAGEYSVTATDANNCETVAMITITADDVIAPVILTQDITISLGIFDGLASITPDQIDAGSTDDCSMVDLSLNVMDFDCSQLGENEIMLTGTDSSGNTTSATAIVTVIDDTAPVVICSENLIITGACDAVVEYSMTEATDNCDDNLEIIMTSGLASGSSFPAGITQQVFEVTDQSGNIGSCFFEVNVVGDVLLPDVLVTEPSCTEFDDGSIEVNVSGGTPPYMIDFMDLDPTQVAAGSYDIAITDANGCTVDVNILVGEPTPIVISEPSIIDATDGQNNGEINVSISGGTGVYTYEWTTNDVVVSTDLNLTNVPAGVYVLIVTDDSGCMVASDEIIIDNLVATTKIEQIEKLSILPNPNTGRFTLSLTLSQTQLVEVQVFNVTGKALLRIAPERLLAKDFQLDLTTMPRGVYWLKVLVENDWVVRKVVVQ